MPTRPGALPASAGQKIGGIERIDWTPTCIEPGMQLMGMVRHGTCVGTRRRLSDLCDGELGEPVGGRVRRHLAGCGRCRRALARLEATIGDVGRLGAVTPPDVASVREQVRRRIVEGTAGAPGPGEGGR